MAKPQTIDRHLCHGKEKEEKYKDLTALDYWWGLRELAADFDIANFVNIEGPELTPRQENDIAYIQILHYTVEVKLAGAFYQIETMERLFAAGLDIQSSLDLRVLEAKESFDALHGDLYQAVCAIANELFMLLNRTNYTPIKVDHTKPIAMSPSDLRYWLKLNRHKDYITISSMVNDCDNLLDIRHHATHYGAVPVYANANTGILYLQKDFRMGGMLTKYDLGRYMKKGGAMSSLVEISRPRSVKLCARINDIYKFIYLSDIFEQFMADRKIAIKDTYKPYWDKS
ncbi:MAG TPA: hypothetical protein VMU10_05430 [Desulfomonilia bacterium]|nr:hypothetical protein [Desulfomonilia bacterium]